MDREIINALWFFLVTILSEQKRFDKNLIDQYNFWRPKWKSNYVIIRKCPHYTCISCKDERRVVIFIHSIYVCAFLDEHLDNILKSYEWINRGKCTRIFRNHDIKRMDWDFSRALILDLPEFCSCVENSTTRFFSSMKWFHKSWNILLTKLFLPICYSLCAQIFFPLNFHLLDKKSLEYEVRFFSVLFIVKKLKKKSISQSRLLHKINKPL